jgi:hypothetical protein
MRVDLGGADILVPEKSLDGLEIRAIREKVGRKRMPEYEKGDQLRAAQASDCRGFLYFLLGCARGAGLAVYPKAPRSKRRRRATGAGRHWTL